MWPIGTFQKVAILKKKSYAYLVVPFLGCSMWDLIYMYMYMYVCVCVCIYIYIYIYIYTL